MKKYRCDSCDGTPEYCEVIGTSNTPKPDTCVFKDGSLQNWRQIEQIDKNCSNDRQTLEHPTPNCSICEWIERPDDRSMISHCAAQGEKCVDECYNSEECKNLFDLKQLPTTEERQL